MGEALAVASLLLFSADVLLLGSASRRVPQDLGFLLALAANVGFAGLVLAGQRLVLGGPFEPDPAALGLFALGGLLTSWLGRWSYFRSVRTIGPTRASALRISNPVFAALAGLLRRRAAGAGRRGRAGAELSGPGPCRRGPGRGRVRT